MKKSTHSQKLPATKLVVRREVVLVLTEDRMRQVAGASQSVCVGCSTEPSWQ